MQIVISDILLVLGFIISSFLGGFYAGLKYLEYKMESDKHKAILKPSWVRLPPKPKALQKSFVRVENIGGRRAVIKEITLKFSYVDAPQILTKRSYIDPGTDSMYGFDFIKPPSINQEHEIVARITTEEGFIRKKRFTKELAWIFIKRE
jgi:hypothetical protein